MKNLSKILSLLLFSLIVTINLEQIKGNEFKESKKIVIIGAGASGIAAATELLSYGFKNLTILEAEPRIGGRIKTIEFGENVIDLGAQFCHGKEGNAVYDLVKDLNLLESSAELIKNATLYRSNGQAIPKDLQQKLDTISAGMPRKPANENIPVYEFIKRELYKALEEPENQNIDKTIADEYILQKFLMDEQTNYENAYGEFTFNWKDKGYVQFLKVLMKSEESGKEFGVLQEMIRLSSQVKRINWQRDDLKVLIECENGEQFLADHVIVTVSLGVLKVQHKTLFEPELPMEKQRGIEFINFGGIGKVFLEFKEKFWPANWAGFSTLWLKQDLNELRRTERGGLEGIFGFYTHPYQPKVLEASVSMSFSHHMEKLPDVVVKNDCLAMLKKFLPWNLTEVVAFVKTDWTIQPNFKGAISYHSAGTEAAGASTRDLQFPLTVSTTNCEIPRDGNCERPVVLFAGEAAHPKHFSSVHGAVESGWREARFLVDYYGIKRPITIFMPWSNNMAEAPLTN